MLKTNLILCYLLGDDLCDTALYGIARAKSKDCPCIHDYDRFSNEIRFS